MTGWENEKERKNKGESTQVAVLISEEREPVLD